MIETNLLGGTKLKHSSPQTRVNCETVLASSLRLVHPVAMAFSIVTLLPACAQISLAEEPSLPQFKQMSTPTEFNVTPSVVPQKPDFSKSPDRSFPIPSILEKAKQSAPLPRHSQTKSNAIIDISKPQIEADLGPYMEAIRKKIEACWYAPKVDEKSVVAVVFSVGSNGDVTDVRVAYSTAPTRADNAALRAVNMASPLPALPAGAPSNIDIQINFGSRVAISSAPGASDEQQNASLEKLKRPSNNQLKRLVLECINSGDLSKARSYLAQMKPDGTISYVPMYINYINYHIVKKIGTANEANLAAASLQGQEFEFKDVSGYKVRWVEDPGDGAFYGPKGKDTVYEPNIDERVEETPFPNSMRVRIPIRRKVRCLDDTDECWSKAKDWLAGLD